MDKKNQKFIMAVMLFVVVAAWTLWPQQNGAPVQPAQAQSAAVEVPAQTEAPAESAASLNADSTWTMDTSLWFDASDIRTAEEYTDEELVYWDEGTFKSPQDSLRYHFNKHGEELPAETVADYLNQAYTTREEVLESTDGWKITESTGDDAAHKYKNREDGRFIIMDDESQKIYSFGR